MHPPLKTVVQMTITGRQLNRNVISAMINGSLPKEDRTSEIRMPDHVSAKSGHPMTHAARNNGRLFNPTEAGPHQEMVISIDPDPAMVVLEEANHPYKKEEETDLPLFKIFPALSKIEF